MNTKELVKRVAKETGATEGQTNHLLKAIFKIITETIADKERVVLTGFGTFYSVLRPYREMSGGKYGKIIVKEMQVPKFSPGKRLRKEVSKGRSK